MVLRTSMFGRQTVRELYKHIGVLDYLIEVNDKEKSIKNRKPNEAKDLEYFYYLCWEMYKLIDDSKFKVAKYDNPKVICRICLPLPKQIHFCSI